MRTAIVHYWLLNRRGGEKVVDALCRLLPGADIYTLFSDPATLSPAMRVHHITTSFLNPLRRYYRSLLPLMPMALESFDLRGYDLVVSSESGPAKGDGTWRAWGKVNWSSHEADWHRGRSRPRRANVAAGAWIRTAGYSDTRAGSGRHGRGVLAGKRRAAQAASLRATGPPGDHSRGHPADRAPVSYVAGKRVSFRGVAQRMPVATEHVRVHAGDREPDRVGRTGASG